MFDKEASVDKETSIVIDGGLTANSSRRLDGTAADRGVLSNAHCVIWRPRDH